MAASSGNISKALTIVWKTERAYKGRGRISSSFSLMGDTWHLGMESDVVGYDYRIKHQNHGCYAIYLWREVQPSRPLPFSVTTYIETNDSSREGCPTRGLMTSYSPTCYWTIWCYRMEFVAQEIPGFRNNSELTVVCVFSDVNSSRCRIENETIDVTTQTDLDRPLPEKLPSDECEQTAASCLSSNLDSLSRDLGKLLLDKILPDVKLRCGDRTVAAHKAVLAARSDVFAAMFQSKMLESETDVVDIPDVDVNVLEWFLKYVYTGRLFDLPDDALPGLYAASDKYAVNDLKKACSDNIIGNLTQENCLNFLLLSDSHSDQDFKSAVIDFILNHLDVLKSHEWTKFRKENLALSSDVSQVIMEQKLFN